MDEAWERAVEAALGGQAESSSSSLPPPAPRSLTLDGAVKCLQGRLPPPEILERYQTLEHLSIANVGVSSLEKFPRLRNLRRLILSDNRIAGGLEFLVEAGLDSLRDLDLSNNRIQYLEDLAPLARLRLVSLDLYECPVTRVKDYRQRVFAMIRTLRYLDKTDADENERLESDEEEDDDEDEEDDEEDPGSGEVDGEERNGRLVNGNGRVVGDVLDVDEDDESDADEEEAEVDGRTQGNGRGSHPHLSNGFRLAPVDVASEEEEDDEEDDDDDLGEEIDEEEGEEEDVVEVHDVGDSDEDVDEVEGEGEEEVDEDDDGDENIDGEEEEEDVEDEEDDAKPESTGRMTSTEGEIDGHEQGEEGDDDENDNGEIGEEDEMGVEEDVNFEEVDGEDDDEDEGAEYLIQPIVQPVEENGGSDFDVHNEEIDEEDEVDEEEEPHSNGVLAHQSSTQLNKRKRDEDKHHLGDDGVDDSKRSPKRH